MKVSALEDHALRCLSQLARHEGRRLTIGSIAGSEGMTEENAAKVLARLREAGLVRSFRGKDGGYELARPARRISVADVLGHIGGGVFELERCHGAGTTDGCVHQEDCGIRPVWLSLGEVVHTFLSSISLADLVAPEKAVCRQIEDIVDTLDMTAAPRATALQPLVLTGGDEPGQDDATRGSGEPA